MNIKELSDFLKKANQNTYANESAEWHEPLRPGSRDYHFTDGNLTYHDTYFGATKFIGEEIVYKNDKPIWGMNYYGFTLDDDMSEELFDSILRPALMQDSGDNIPVRGPKEYVNGEWKYTFRVDGDLANFTGMEEVAKNGVVVARTYCHGGIIKQRRKK